MNLRGVINLVKRKEGILSQADANEIKKAIMDNPFLIESEELEELKQEIYKIEKEKKIREPIAANY